MWLIQDVVIVMTTTQSAVVKILACFLLVGVTGTVTQKNRAVQVS